MCKVCTCDTLCCTKKWAVGRQRRRGRSVGRSPEGQEAWGGCREGLEPRGWGVEAGRTCGCYRISATMIELLYERGEQVVE